MPRTHCHNRHLMTKFFRYLQDPKATWRDWTFLTITQKKAEQMERDGDVEKVTRLVDGEVQVVGFRATKPNILERPTPCTLTFGTMKAVAKRAQQCELTRRERREVEKFLVWPLIGDTKAVAVRPRMYPHELALANSVLRRGYLQDLPRAA